MPTDHVLTTASTIVCTHTASTSPPAGTVPPALGGGAMVVITGVRALRVEGKAVLPFRQVPAALHGTCTVPSTAGSSPCTGVATLIASAASRLFVNGTPVLLAKTFAAMTTGVPPPAFDIEVEHNKLRAE